MDLSDPKNKAVYEEGRRSYFKNNGAYHCPYPEDSDEAWLFERGWSQAIRSSDDSEKDWSDKELTLADKYSDTRWGSKSSSSKINSYAAAKGGYE